MDIRSGRTGENGKAIRANWPKSAKWSAKMALRKEKPKKGERE